MLNNWIAVLAMASAVGFAENPAKEVDVLILDPQVPATSFQKTGVNLKSIPGADPNSSLLSVADTDKALQQAGLSNHVNTWDQVDKDLFVITVRTQSLDDAAKAYPDIPKVRLNELKTALEKWSRR